VRELMRGVAVSLSSLSETGFQLTDVSTSVIKPISSSIRIPCESGSTKLLQKSYLATSSTISIHVEHINTMLKIACESHA